MGRERCFTNSAPAVSIREKPITFSAAGTKTVSHVMTFQPKYGNQMGGGAILEAIGADASGRHGILTQGSNNANFNITCTSGSGK
jgi:hypothetical protein